MNALVVGDLVHHKAHAWLEGGIINGTPKPTISGWIDDLSELARQFKQTNPDVFGGRGKIAPLSKVAPEQISYLKKADKLVSTYLTTVKDKSELTGNNAQRHYKALQQLFEKAFAAYDLSYMIGYGVYGLVSQKLAETK